MFAGHAVFKYITYRLVWSQVYFAAKADGRIQVLLNGSTNVAFGETIKVTYKKDFKVFGKM